MSPKADRDMDRELLELYDKEERQNLPVPAFESRVDRSDNIVRIVGTGFNSVVFSKLGSDDADTIIDEQIRDYGFLGREFEWKYFRHDGPPDLELRLKAR